MFRRTYSIIPRVEHLETRPNAAMVVDQFDGEDFNANACGWSRNDISQLARAQSKQEFDMYLSRLQEVKDQKSNLVDKLSLSENFGRIRPRYCQSFVETQQFAEMVGNYDASKLDDAYRKSVANEEPASEPSSVEPSSE